MPRVKRGTKRRAKRIKILERASGYFLTKSKLYRSAKEAVDRALRRRRPIAWPELQPVDQRPEKSRRGTRPQNPGRFSGKRSSRIWQPSRASKESKRSGSGVAAAFGN